MTTSTTTAHDVGSLLNAERYVPVGKTMVALLLTDFGSDKERLMAALMMSVLAASASFESEDRKAALTEAVDQLDDVIGELKTFFAEISEPSSHNIH